jgi:hypothetical protein
MVMINATTRVNVSSPRIVGELAQAPHDPNARAEMALL